MTNLILFLNSFLSYLFLFVLIAVLVVIACILGAKWGKNKAARKDGGAENPALSDPVDIK